MTLSTFMEYIYNSCCARKDTDQHQETISHMSDILFPSSISTREQDDCIICLTENTSCTSIEVCSNHHVYHKDCIKPWLENHTVCPICKVHIDEKTYIALKLYYPIDYSYILNNMNDEELSLWCLEYLEVFILIINLFESRLGYHTLRRKVHEQYTKVNDLYYKGIIYTYIRDCISDHREEHEIALNYMRRTCYICIEEGEWYDNVD